MQTIKQAVIISITFFFVLGVFLYTQAGGNTITACATKAGSIYLVGDGFLYKECRKGHTPISWDTQGWNESRITELENRVAELEKSFP